MTRNIRVSAISLYLPDCISTIDENLARAKAAVRQALTEEPDIVLLPEFFAIMGTDPRAYLDLLLEAARRWFEITQELQDLAREFSSYIVSTGPKLEHGILYNTASVIDRHGQVLGHYRKTHRAPGETAFEAGNDYPVFETDFGRIAIMICMDIHYPEVARIYALRGAELLLWPTMSWGPTDQCLTVLLAARAIDNQVYCAGSNYARLPYLPGQGRGRACVVGPDGVTRADTGHRPGIATALIDLDEGYEFWETGELKRQLPTLKEVYLGLRRPDTYGELVREDIPSTRWRVRQPQLVAPPDRSDNASADDAQAREKAALADAETGS